MLVTHALFPHISGPATLVLHDSVALRWVVPTLDTTYSRNIMTAMVRENAAVPGCWLVTLTDGVKDAERRRLLTPSVATSKLATLRKYPILFDDETDIRLWSDILPLARTYNLSVFDAAYLELALRLNLPRATTDATLTRVGTSVGAPLFTP
jgi:predicted nucleic acid-binding protein